MVVVPTSRIILLKNPIEIDYLNELTFSSKQKQFDYFYNLPKIECNNATYQRKEGVIRFPTDPQMQGITYDDLIEYNYCMYQNNNWSDKWFYAFVKKVTYDNTGMSYIEIETDVWQTWCFDITFKNSFIEREHVNDDTVGKHTVPENLELGDMIINNTVEALEDGSTFKICFGVTEFPDETLPTSINKVYNGVYGGLYYIACEDEASATNLIRLYDENSKADAIVTLFMVPLSFLTLQTFTLSNSSQTIESTVRYVENDTESTNLGYCYIDMPTSLDSYTPKNNKLLTFPFTYCNATNNSGITIPFRFEDSTSEDNLTHKKLLMFSLEGSITPGLSIKAIPLNYKKLTENYQYGIMLGKFPVCSWSSDVYINWLTQNGANTMINTISNVGNNVVSASMGNPSGFSGTITGIFNAIQQFRVAELTPDQARGNINSGDINFSYANSGGFTLYNVSIKEEYAKIIDGYFSMFGYKVNSVKLPNITGRRYWNYVKTIGCNIIGDIPQSDLEKIKEIFNNGVTMWHDYTKFLDYSQNNTIVT